MLLDVETESENWIFLKYARIGKHPMQSLYTVPCDRRYMFLNWKACTSSCLHLALSLEEVQVL